MIFSADKFSLMTSGIYEISMAVASRYRQKSLDEHVNDAFTAANGEDAMDVTMLHLHAIVCSIMADGRTYDDVKKDLLYVANRITLRYINTNQSLGVEEKRFKEFLLHKIQALREKQMKEGALETSTITGCAIIAPYAGTITKPSHTIFTQNLNSANLQNRAGDEMDAMFYNPELMDKIMPFSNIFAEIAGPDRVHDVFAMLSESRRINPAMSIAITYYAWAYIYKNAHVLPLKQMALYLENIEGIKDVPLRDAMESVMELLPADEASLLSHLQDYDKLSKFMSTPVEVKKTMSDATTPEELGFDLTPLFNFIFTSRRFFAKEYTNQTFVTSSIVAGYTFYKDFMVIYPRSDDDETLDYVYVPTIDELNDGHVAIIKYFRDGHIDILTEAQYYEETGKTS